MRKSALFVFGLVVAIIAALGFVVLMSAGADTGLRLHHNAYYFAQHQAAYMVAGLVACVVVASIDYHIWREKPVLTCVAFCAVLALLGAVLFTAKINGSRRWLNLHFFSLQPSELAKIMTVIAVGVWLDIVGWRVELFMRGALIPVVIIGAPALLVMVEPDFGSTVVIGLVGLLIIFVAGSKLLHMLPFGLIGGAIVVAKVLADPNRMARIAAWVGVKVDIGAKVAANAAKAAEWQGSMALAALAKGGLWGCGLNQSMQKRLWLPEAHTDMIFAVGAEELGLSFSIATLLLFVIFFALGVYIASKASDRFGRFLVVGMAFLIFFQAIFNIGVVCEALPMKGMALPFFSYGGTNMICSFIAVGVILSVGIHSCGEKRRAFVRKIVVNS